MDASATLADPAALTRRAAALIEGGRTSAARPLLAAIRRMAPPSADLARISARLAIREGRLQDAADELDAAVAAAPEDAQLRITRAELRIQTDDPVGAAVDAAEAVILDRGDVAAKALLGVALLELGRASDAAACLDEASRMEPANPFLRQALAAALEACGEAARAEASLAEGIAACPGATALRNAAIMLCIRRGDLAGAVAQAEAARRAGAVDACVFGLRGHALSSLGRHDEAALAYREALKLAPDDPYVRHLVAAAGALPSAERAAEPYLRAVFDGYAERFETHLLQLGYRVPGLIRAALLRHLPHSESGGATPPVLDLGCGTGLLGVACCDLPFGPWVGVDVSARMLTQAASKQFYAELHEADLMGWLSAEERRWPVVLAGDVFCYFGALEPAFARIAGRLLPGGLLVLSLEELVPACDGTSPSSAWRLGRQGRYAHTGAYLQEAAEAACLEVRAIDREALRNEAGAPVAGLLAVLVRPR